MRSAKVGRTWFSGRQGVIGFERQVVGVLILGGQKPAMKPVPSGHSQMPEVSIGSGQPGSFGAGEVEHRAPFSKHRQVNAQPLRHRAP